MVLVFALEADQVTVVENAKCVRILCVCPQAIGEVAWPRSHFEEVRSSFVVLDCVSCVTGRLNRPNLKPRVLTVLL